MLTPAEQTALTKRLAREQGFALAGVCPAVTPTGLHHFHEWLESGHAGQMHYLESRREAYAHPRHVLTGVRSIVMLGLHYESQSLPNTQPGQGRVARYAQGSIDYHDLIHDRLKTLIRVLQDANPAATYRGVVDTAPMLEREFAELAGLGWLGKNTMLIHKHAGSYFFLAALLTDEELQYDAPHATSHCGTCRACIDACPTGAILRPQVLDARRCISYLTIELRDPIPAELRPGLGDWVFGCDVCQEVCPWNRKAPGTREPDLAASEAEASIDLHALFELDDEAFRRRFRHTPLWRPRRRGILRNAAIVLGNQRDSRALTALRRGLDDSESLVRGAAAWALGQLATRESRTMLEQRLNREEDPCIQAEIAAALRHAESANDAT